jgi:photosystem II PsbU protein
MKRLIRWLSILSILVGCLGWLGTPTAMAQSMGGGMSFQSRSFVLAEVEANVEMRNRVADKMATEFGKKLDLNNTNLRAFREIQGMYPTLAGILVKNAPYKAIDEIFDIAGLTDAQKDTLDKNLDKFVISDPEAALVEGADRINNGIYR